MVQSLGRTLLDLYFYTYDKDAYYNFSSLPLLYNFVYYFHHIFLDSFFHQIVQDKLFYSFSIVFHHHKDLYKVHIIHVEVFIKWSKPYKTFVKVLGLIFIIMKLFRNYM